MAVAVVALALSATGTAFAATGQSLLLGKSNDASRTTSITSSRGEPLSLRGPAKEAPLKVSSVMKVRRLNADLLDGIDASRFALTADAQASLSGAVLMFAGGSCPPGTTPANGLTGNYGAEDTSAALFGEYLYAIVDHGFGPTIARGHEPLRMSACRID